jgi:hypothetical protein
VGGQCGDLAVVVKKARAEDGNARDVRRRVDPLVSDEVTDKLLDRMRDAHVLGALQTLHARVLR